MKHESFVRRFIHHLGNETELDAGSLKQIHDKHKPDILGGLNFLINRGSHVGGSFVGKALKTVAKGAWQDMPFKNTIEALDTVGHKTSKAIGGNINEDTRLGGSHFGGSISAAGSMYSGGSLYTGGSYYSGGGVVSAGGLKHNMRPFTKAVTNLAHGKIEKQPPDMHAVKQPHLPDVAPSNAQGGGFEDHYGMKDHKDMYHHILSLSPAHWELYREKAAQILGARPSPMWDHLPQLGNKDLESAPENYQHIMRMPNTHAAARLLEAEASSKHGGSLKAFQHIHKALRPLYPALQSDKLANLNPKIEAEQLKSFLRPIGKSVEHAMDRQIHPEQAFHHVKRAFHSSVQEHLPSLQDHVFQSLSLDKSPKSRSTLSYHHSPKSQGRRFRPVHVNIPAIKEHVKRENNNPLIPDKVGDSVVKNQSAAPTKENMSVPVGGAIRRPC